MPLTKQEINDICLESAGDKLLFPVVPTWSIRVNGRKFGDYLAIARKKPRRSLLFLPIADPCSKFANIWGSIATLNDFTYTAFVVPLSLAFNDYTSPNVYWYLDLLGSIIYILDLIIEFHVGFVVRWDASSVTITDGMQVAKNYMRNGTFWIDAIACLPIIGQIIIAATSGDRMSSASVRSILLLKLLRLGRVIRLIARMNQFDTGGIFHQWIATRVNSVTMFACNTFFSLMVMINLLACMWWWIAITQGLQHSWVAAVAINKPDIDITNGSDGVRWLVCAYYSLVTMATIGYGDIVPVTTAEIALVIVFIFCGVAFFGFVLSTVSALLESRSNEDSTSGADWIKFQEMETWMRRFSFPKRLQREIRRHCYAASISSVTANHDAEYYNALPLWLKAKVAIELQKTGLIALVGGQAVWDTLPEDTQTAVARIVAVMSQPELFQSNFKVFSVGEKCNYIYFVEEGQVGLYVPGVAKVVTISSPAIMGTGSLFGDWCEACGIWKASARTTSRCFFWKINSATLKRELLNIAPEVLEMILHHYIDELQRARDQLGRYGNTDKRVPGLVSLRKSYEVRIDGALRASEDLKKTMKATSKQRQEAKLTKQKTKFGEKVDLSYLDKIAEQETGMRGVEQDDGGAIEHVSKAEAAAAHSFASEAQGGSRADAEDLEIDLEGNRADITEALENKLNQTQANMYLEEMQSSTEVSPSSAVGVLRKEGNTTFVV
jgi:CRP-like cAMP-binding protein